MFSRADQEIMLNEGEKKKKKTLVIELALTVVFHSN